MPLSYSDAVANARLDQVEVAIGPSAILRLYGGTPPQAVTAPLSANPVVAQGQLPDDYLKAAALRQKELTAPWVLTGSQDAGQGTAATFFRLLDSAAQTPHVQGGVSARVMVTTSQATPARGNALTFASAPAGVAPGMGAVGTGVPVGASVVEVVGGSVILSHTCVLGVPSGATITFGADMTLDNVSIASGQVVTIPDFVLAAGN